MKHARIPERGWLLAVCALFLSACNGSGDSGGIIGFTPFPASTQAAVQELVDSFAATLTGAQEVPARPSSATAAGTVVVQASTRRMNAVLTTTGIAGTAANIHQAQPGIIGPIVFPLTETPPGSGVWSATATLTEAQYNAFKVGDFYFNVQSLAFGDGEIRGQIGTQLNSGNAATGSAATGAPIGLSSSVVSTATFLTALRGQHEVPPNTSTALGAGTVLIAPASRQLVAAVATSGIAGTAAHIHQAAPGINGPIIVPLSETSPGLGVWSAKATLTEDQFAAMRAGNMYFNVHSAAFPEGEIRGQIIAQQLSLPGVTGATGFTPTGTSGPTTPIGTGTTGIGTTGIGTTGIGTTGIGTTGIGTTGAGSGLTGLGTPLPSLEIPLVPTLNSGGGAEQETASLAR